MTGWVRNKARGFAGDRAGATAVEFAILMPIMLVCFGAIVEGARIYWNYQSAITGVRDAVRYLARVTDVEICGGATSLTPVDLPDGDSTARRIIERNVGTGSANLFPTAVRIDAVQASFICPDLNLRTRPTPVAQVQATLTVDLPFGAVFEFFGPRRNSQMISTIVDQARIYGI